VSVTMDRIGVVLVDDDAFVRQGLRALFDAQPDMDVLGEAADCDEALGLMDSADAQVIVAEARFPGRGCLGLLDGLRRLRLQAAVVVLTREERSDDVPRLVQAGAAAYLSKSASTAQILEAVRTVAEGGHVLDPQALDVLLQDYHSRLRLSGRQRAHLLTMREREVLTLVAEGHTTREIAAELSLSAKTVEVHRRRIMDKLHMHKAADLVRYAVREGLVGMDPP
jgi:two-component system response regulator NreC